MGKRIRRFLWPKDPRARLVGLFMLAVLAPSIALSVLSYDAVPKYVESLKNTLLRRAEHVLVYIELDLEASARQEAVKAAGALETELLLEGRPGRIREALVAAGFAEQEFRLLRLEPFSPLSPVHTPRRGPPSEVRLLREALGGLADRRAGSGANMVTLTRPDGTPTGVLRYQFASAYAHGKLLRAYFTREAWNPGESWVVRVTDRTGEVLYENASTAAGTPFEVRRVITSPSFEGLELFLRFRERSIRQEVRRFAFMKIGLIGLIDIVLLGGLILVYVNVKREIYLSRLKSDFVANVSHELKTPLALVRLFAETLELGRVQGVEKAQQYYRIINKESQRLTQLINNILDFSRIEAGRRQYRFKGTDVARVVEDVLEAYRFHVEQQGFVLEVEMGEELPEIEADPEALSQAVLNLLNNAVKYSRGEPRIRVSVRRDDDRLLVAVQDWGIGVPKADQKRIFEKFYRGEDSLVHETKGSGLGLALVRHIMEAHGGSVELESVPGKGSTFTLVLPIEKRKV